MRKLLVMSLVVLVGLTASAGGRRPTVHVIRHDDGGVLTTYIARYVNWDDAGDSARIEGDCMSACTLILGNLDNRRICATHDARFGFHSAALQPSNRFSQAGTEFMWFFYGDDARAVLAQHGWPTPSYHPNFLMIDAQEIVQACE